MVDAVRGAYLAESGRSTGEFLLREVLPSGAVTSVGRERTGDPSRPFRGQGAAVVTGAAQGIGRAVALGMAAEGGHVVLVDRSELVHEVAAEITSRWRSRPSPSHADLEHYAECVRVMAAVGSAGSTSW